MDEYAKIRAEMLKGQPILTQIGKQVHNKLTKDWDLPIAVCGTEGVGKSTLATLLAAAIQPTFRMDKNLSWTPVAKELIEQFNELPQYGALVIDEAIKNMYKRKWFSKMQIFINTAYAVSREQNKVTILCMPNFRDFSPYWRNHRIQSWVQVIDRGHAVVFKKDSSAFTKDPWHIDENNKIIENKLSRRKYKDLKPKDYLDAYKRLRTYAMDFTFKPLPRKVFAEYKRLGKERKGEVAYEEEGGLTKLYRNAAVQACRILYTENGLKQSDIGKELGLGQQTVSRMLGESGLRRKDQGKDLNRVSEL